MSDSAMSEDIKNFSSNEEVMGLVKQLWNLAGRNNSKVEFMLSLCTGPSDDDVIVKLEQQIEKLEEPDKHIEHFIRSTFARGSKRKSKKSSRKRRNKKSSKRRNKKSYKKRK
jgi:hypothetical protein